MKKTNDIAIKEDTSVESFISQAIAGNVPMETLERLFVLRKEVKAEAAREAYTQALADFQSACPIIEKTKKVLNKDGRSVRYVFAPIDSIVSQIKKPLANAGLSYRWETRQEGKAVTAICIVTHKLGHSEKSEFTIEVDQEGFMTAPQKIASALTFAKRYSLLNALGISTGDEDTDATDVGAEPEAQSIKSKILFRLRALNKNTATKETIETAVLDLTKLELREQNYEDIADRLQVLIDEKNADPIIS